MLKQPDGEETGVDNGKVNLDRKAHSSPSASKRDLGEPHISPERKRIRTDSAGESKLVNVPRDDSKGNKNLEGQLRVQSTGNETLGESSKDGKGMQQHTSATGNKIVGAKAPKKSIVTTLSAEVAEDRGSRLTMEDAWVILHQAWLGTPGKLRLAHFAIYDGHGGRHAAEYACAHLHANVLSAGLTRELMDVKGVKRAIMQGFKTTDEALLRESSTGGWQDGATAVSVWVLGQMVFVANLGDAKAVLARAPAKGEGGPLVNSPAGLTGSTKEVPLKGLVVTREHKAIFPVERARIEKAGGFVEANGRLLGRLEVSRAFGDRNFKKAGVIAVPDIHVFELSEREHFLILGCDGLWGVFGPSDAVEFVAEQLKGGATVGVACRRLIREAVRERKCKDNCTAIVITFDHLQV
ncbi:unnamed protein product [Calypogeia fissa]